MLGRCLLARLHGCEDQRRKQRLFQKMKKFRRYINIFFPLISSNDLRLVDI
jgi:hypothetical protein